PTSTARSPVPVKGATEVQISSTRSGQNDRVEPDIPLPLLEFDDEAEAVLEPGRIFRKKQGTVPAAAVLCFFAEVLEVAAAEEGTTVAGRLEAAHGHHTIWSLDRDGRRVAV